MAFKLIYTSAPRLLQAGRSGFGIAAMHRNIPPQAIRTAEMRSQFSRLPGFPVTRVVYSYRIVQASGAAWHILSCVRDAGADYSGRTNHLAQHIILSEQEAAAHAARGETPASVMLDDHWLDYKGEIQWLEDEVVLGPKPPDAYGPWWAHYAPSADCRYSLAESTASSGLVFEYAKGLESQDAETAMKVLYLLSEAQAACPHRGWGVTFTTALEPADELSDFRWIGVPSGSPMLSQLRSLQRRQWITLDDPPPAKSSRSADLNQPPAAGARAENPAWQPPFVPKTGGSAVGRTSEISSGKPSDPSRLEPASARNYPRFALWIGVLLLLSLAGSAVYFVFFAKRPITVELEDHWQGTPNLSYNSTREQAEKTVLSYVKVKEPGHYSLTTKSQADQGEIPVIITFTAKSVTSSSASHPSPTDPLAPGTYDVRVEVNGNSGDFAPYLLVKDNALSVGPAENKPGATGNADASKVARAQSSPSPTPSATPVPSPSPRPEVSSLPASPPEPLRVVLLTSQAKLEDVPLKYWLGWKGDESPKLTTLKWAEPGATNSVKVTISGTNGCIGRTSILDLDPISRQPFRNTGKDPLLYHVDPGHPQRGTFVLEIRPDEASRSPATNAVAALARAAATDDPLHLLAANNGLSVQPNEFFKGVEWRPEDKFALWVVFTNSTIAPLPVRKDGRVDISRLEAKVNSPAPPTITERIKQALNSWKSNNPDWKDNDEKALTTLNNNLRPPNPVDFGADRSAAAVQGIREISTAADLVLPPVKQGADLWNGNPHVPENLIRSSVFLTNYAQLDAANMMKFLESANPALSVDVMCKQIGDWLNARGPQGSAETPRQVVEQLRQFLKVLKTEAAAPSIDSREDIQKFLDGLKQNKIVATCALKLAPFDKGDGSPSYTIWVSPSKP